MVRTLRESAEAISDEKIQRHALGIASAIDADYPCITPEAIAGYINLLQLMMRAVRNLDTFPDDLLRGTEGFLAAIYNLLNDEEDPEVGDEEEEARCAFLLQRQQQEVRKSIEMFLQVIGDRLDQIDELNEDRRALLAGCPGTRDGDLPEIAERLLLLLTPPTSALSILRSGFLEKRHLQRQAVWLRTKIESDGGESAQYEPMLSHVEEQLRVLKGPSKN